MSGEAKTLVAEGCQPGAEPDNKPLTQIKWVEKHPTGMGQGQIKGQRKAGTGNGLVHTQWHEALFYCTRNQVQCPADELKWILSLVFQPGDRWEYK